MHEVDAVRDEMCAELVELVRCPSISGSDEENGAQEALARDLDGWGLETDHWEIPLEETIAEQDFPGVEVPRSEAWGLVGRLPGAGDGPTLMLTGHIDVVPAGDLHTWADEDPWSGLAHGSDESVPFAEVQACARTLAVLALDVVGCG